MSESIPPSGSGGLPLAPDHQPRGYVISATSDLLRATLDPYDGSTVELRHSLWHALTGETDDLTFLTKGTDAFFQYYQDCIQRYAWKCSATTHLEIFEVVKLLRQRVDFGDIVHRLNGPAQDAVLSLSEKPAPSVEQQLGAASAGLQGGEPDSLQGLHAKPELDPEMPHDKGNQAQPSKDADSPFQEDIVKDDLYKGTVWLAARILSMHDIGRFPGTSPGNKTVNWVENCFHEVLVQEHERGEARNAVLLEYDAAKLEMYARIQIKFTDNLAQHLWVQHNPGHPQTIHVFSHVRYLRAMAKNLKGELFPPGLLEETIRTINLLFPPGDPMIQRCFGKRVAKDPKIDQLVLQCDNSDAGVEDTSSGYPYWSERLVLLQDRYKNAKPQTMREALFDNRPASRLGMTLVILGIFLTAFFGLVQSIEGGVQAYKAYEPSTGQ